MKMRKIPMRGEKYNCDGAEVTVLTSDKDGVEVILPTGKTGRVLKNFMNLPVIETKDYEKL